MATALVNEKIIGGMGIAAVIVFIVAMFTAAFMKSDFDFGSGNLGDLTEETYFVAGCVIAGILGALFGLFITLNKEDSKVFIGRVRGILMISSGAVLVILGLTNGNIWVVYLFVLLIVLSAASDMFYDWVVDQKLLMVFSLILTLFIALTGILSLTSDNNILWFAFVLFVSIWILFVALMRFAPVVEAEPASGKKDKKAKAEKETKKKNAPAPRPYPARKEEPSTPKKSVTEKTVYKEEMKKKETKKEEPVKEETKPEVKEEIPKLKVMSSREAAMARDTARKKEEPAVPAPAVESAPVNESMTVVQEEETRIVSEQAEEVPEEVPEVDISTEEYEEEFEIVEDTPDALLRRATWNKGLRCRRDYGPYRIPIAFVKAKVAVYVLPEKVDASSDEELKAEGWTIFRYLESEITDGKEQADEINKAVKENLRAERVARKKKSSKK